jgi:membrane-bound serine protease (ClpP class)
VIGAEQIVHEQGTALDEFSAEHGHYSGHVRISGERWKARSSTPVAAGDPIRVTGIDGLTVTVEVIQETD